MLRLLLTLMLFGCTVRAFAKPEHELFAAVLVLEAAGEGRQGMQAVANVIVNRTERRQSTFRREILRPRQFSSLNGRSETHAIELARRDSSWTVAIELAALARSGGLRDITGGATHFHSGKRPRWARYMAPTVTIGRHFFYRGR